MADVHPLFLLTSLTFWTPIIFLGFYFIRTKVSAARLAEAPRLKTRKLKNNLVFTDTQIGLILYFFILSVLTSKFVLATRIDQLILLSVLLNGIFITGLLRAANRKSRAAVVPALGVFLTAASTLLFITTDLVSYFLVLEIFATLYMYAFLVEQQATVSLLKFKNSILVYLFGSFLTTVFFFLGLLNILSTAGSVHFFELVVLHSEIKPLGSAFIIIALLFKIGGPATFFFKLELYKLLNPEAVLVFSIFTFSFNTLLLYFILTSCLYSILLHKTLILVLLLLANIPVILLGYRSQSLGFFLGFSALVTWGFILTCFLVLFRVTNFSQYSTEQLASARAETAKSICFKPDLAFLKLHKNLTRSLSNRTTRGSKFIKGYLNVRKWYINHQRATHCAGDHPNRELYLFKNLKNRDFIEAYWEFNYLRNFDNVLLWRGRTIESIFNIKISYTRKRKKEYFDEVVYYLNPTQRINFPWKWLARSIQAFYSKEVPFKASATPPLENFLCAPKEQHIILGFKQKAYRLFAIRTA